VGSLFFLRNKSYLSFICLNFKKTPNFHILIKTICYISNICQNLTSDDIHKLKARIVIKNNQHGITGILLIKNGHVFQIIEGSTDYIDKLYLKIYQDHRHNGIIKLLDKTIKDHIFSLYGAGKFSVVSNYSDLKKLYLYFNWIKEANYLPANEIIHLTKNFLKYNT
tara:strand:+ start:1851 stop:2348 length:498 start_codon:yes stop_codon:yes gene_type:complete